MWRALETESRNILNGHEGGNAGHGQGSSYGFTRQRSTYRHKERGLIEKAHLTLFTDRQDEFIASAALQERARGDTNTPTGHYPYARCPDPAYLPGIMIG